jgi:ABC-type multidrug transport system ATPase subunit/ABC-type multidrug transport system permease subunit
MTAPAPLPQLGPETIRPDNGAVVIGRAQDADVRLPHPAVSRRHAALEVVSGRLLVRSLGSRAGVRVNGQPVTDAQELHNGDRVDFGPVSYHVVGQHLKLRARPEGVRLEARGLAVARGGRTLLSGVGLVIAPNQFVGILGPSGAGKTSLLNCLAGYSPPAAGQLTFDGVAASVWRAEGGGAEAGYVPQGTVLYPALTGRENLDFALRLRSPDPMAHEERDGILADVLTQVDMAGRADGRVAVLSGGEQRRLNVALELLARPRLLLLDEPTSGLDPANEVRIMRLLKELSCRGITVVCSTHVLANVELFDQVVVVAEGSVVYGGPPGRVLKHFGVPNFPALYEALEDRQQRPAASLPQPPAPAPSQDLGPRPPLGTPVTPRHEEPAPRIPLARQVLVHVQRGALRVGRDRALLALLVGQPLFIGLLINLSQLSPDGQATVFLLCVVTAVWLGLNNTAREVVRDRLVYVRERMAGVTPEGYLLAKVLLYGAIGVAQVVLLLLVVRHVNGMPAGDAADLRAWSLPYLATVLWATYLSALLLGLLISTLANSEEAAVAALPLVVLPQLLLSGVVTGLGSDRDGSFRSLVLLVGRAGAVSRGFTAWLLELLSLLTYSRPATVLLQEGRGSPGVLARVVDILHLLVLLLVTGSALVLTFRRRERRWIERG